MPMIKSLLGQQFKNICFTGLNRVEYLPDGSDQPIFGDSWQDVSDDQARRTMCLAFFAPRDLSGEPVDPASILIENYSDEDVPDAIAAESIKHIPLMDYCRMPPADSNTVNFIVVADVIFHWDIKDNYLQPTSQLTWVQDIKAILKSYPRSYTKNVYTNWQKDKLEELRVNVLPLRESPVFSEVWLNMPSFQEKHGNIMLTLGILVSLVAFAITYMQDMKIKELQDQKRSVVSSMPSGQNFSVLSNLIRTQQQNMSYREYFPFILKDISYAIQYSGMKIDSFELEVPNPQEIPKNLLLTINANSDAYDGWLEEEPVAKSFLALSSTVQAVRRQPGSKKMKLEGIIPLRSAIKEIHPYLQEARKTRAIGNRTLGNTSEEKNKETGDDS
jgi:hypothetical protein